MEPGVQRLYAIVDVENLAVTVELLLDRLFDDGLFIGPDMRGDRKPARGRGLDNRELAHSGQGKRERSGNRRGRQGQDIQMRPELFDLLLVFDAEAMLLINDQKSQVLKHNAL